MFQDYLSVPKRQFQTTSRRLINQKTEELGLTAAEVYDLAKLYCCFKLFTKCVFRRSMTAASGQRKHIHINSVPHKH
jgi:hypothetical protein